MFFQLRHRSVNVTETPLVMGVLNVTPDSFSDGGDFVTVEAALARAGQMIAEGADIIDVGPESTRPASPSISADDQIARAIPVIEGIRGHHSDVAISIDTRVASVARAAIDAGADIINDVSALRDDPAMGNVAAERDVPVVLMHMRGAPANMQRDGGPTYDDVVGEIVSFLDERRAYALSCGVKPERIVFDPGIGFGKRVEHNLTILNELERLVALQQPVLIGASRKSFIGHVLGVDQPKDRDAASIACAVVAVMGGAAMVRVHDVCGTVEALRLCAAIRRQCR